MRPEGPREEDDKEGTGMAQFQSCHCHVDLERPLQSHPSRTLSTTLKQQKRKAHLWRPGDVDNGYGGTRCLESSKRCPHKVRKPAPSFWMEVQTILCEKYRGNVRNLE